LMGADAVFVNSLGMRFVHIPAGSFLMGNDRPLPDELVRLPNRRYGDFDERPIRLVRLTKPFKMATTEVTNAQFEAFDPSHRQLRGKLGFSTGDNEAAVFVNWFEACAFCEWLSRREGLPYRLPTEAEWEYACRAGTTTAYHTGDSLSAEFHKNVGVKWFPDPSRGADEQEIPELTVGQTPPNPWGLYDMHGNVEEWCHDWYGPYDAHRPNDPVGTLDGNFRVTRGGSHSTELYYLRSSNRMGTVPEERSWIIGFRPVIGEMPSTNAIPGPIQLHESNVKPEIPRDITCGPDPSKPFFCGPRTYVKVPPDSYGPMFSRHNHVPAIVACPNGDLLAMWYTCMEEAGREVATLASRLRWGKDEWEPASLFWDAPDRNDHACALWRSKSGRLFHFSGLSVAATWGPLAVVMRTSDNSGATWSKARLIIPEHGVRHMPIAGVIQLSDGTIVLPCDAVTAGHGGSALWMSEDEGDTWYDAGGTIAGIHANVVELSDGRLMALGRGDDIDGRMPMSLSEDKGKTWKYSASPFLPIHGGQRLVLFRLQEGPLLFVSFANDPLEITDATGTRRSITGLYCAVSFDEGATWANFRVMSDDGLPRPVEAFDGRPNILSASQSEVAGYMTVCQADNGLIHLISSRNHYAFNLAWLKEPPPGEQHVRQVEP